MKGFLNTSTHGLEIYKNGGYSNIKKYNLSLDIVQLCSVYLEAYKSWINNLPMLNVNQNLGLEIHISNNDLWANLWKFMPHALFYYWTHKIWEHPDSMNQSYADSKIPVLSSPEYFAQDCELATQCLKMIEEIEQITLVNNEISNIQFPIELSEKLNLWIPPHTHENA